MNFPFLKKIPVIRRLFDVSLADAADPANLPKILYLYWDSGFADAPQICRWCRDSWIEHNPDWMIVELDKKAASEFLDPSSLPDAIEPCHYADLLRVELLRRTGGVWADATLLCMRPLDEWLPYMFTQSDLFVFTRPAPDRLVSNWFIAASVGSWGIEKWADRSQRFWRGRRRLPLNYFWQHALFQELVLGGGRFRRAFRSMPQMSADTCHRLLYGLRKGRLSELDRSLILASPVQKLSHKDGFSIFEIETALSTCQTEKPTGGSGI